jgi:hypothetical protein
MAATPTTPTPDAVVLTPGQFAAPAVKPTAKQVAAVVASLPDAWLAISGNTPAKPQAHNAAVAYAAWLKADATAAKAAAVGATAAYGDAGGPALAAATLYALGAPRSAAGQLAKQLAGTPAKAKAGYAAAAYANVATAGAVVPAKQATGKAYYAQHQLAYRTTANGNAAAASYNALRAAQA